MIRASTERPAWASGLGIPDPAAGVKALAPVGAHARFEGARLSLRGVIAALDGSRLVRGASSATVADAGAADALGVALAQRLLAEGGAGLLGRLQTNSEETCHSIAAASDRLTSTLNFKTEHIGDEFIEITANLQYMMSMRLDRVTEGFAQKSASILDMMTNRSQEMTDLVIETGNRLTETISSRVEEVNTTLKTTGDSLVHLDPRHVEVGPGGGVGSGGR